jgi:hypothetical protein
MKEKKKGKFIPFASYLRPTEELLWQTPEHLTSSLPTVYFSIPRAAALLLFAITAIALVREYFRSPLGIWTILVFIGLPFTLIFFLNYLLKGRIFKVTLPDTTRYAITSERLLYERGDNLRAESLDNILLINVLSENTLSFGEAFPRWTALRDAEQIKLIIEQAQRERLKALSMSDGDEYLLDQAQSYKNSIAK